MYYNMHGAHEHVHTGDPSCDRALLLLLCSWQPDVKLAFPKQERIANACRVGERQARRILRKLEGEENPVTGERENGWIRLVGLFDVRHRRVFDTPGYGRHPCYEIDIARVEAMIAAGEAAKAARQKRKAQRTAAELPLFDGDPGGGPTVNGAGEIADTQDVRSSGGVKNLESGHPGMSAHSKNSGHLEAELADTQDVRLRDSKRDQSRTSRASADPAAVENSDDGVNHRASLRAAVVAKEGEGFAVSWLDPCAINGSVILARKLCAERLINALGVLWLADRGYRVEVADAATVARALREPASPSSPAAGRGRGS